MINGAGGKNPNATTSAEKTFFDLPLEGFRRVFDLNLLGTIIPSQVVGRHMTERRQGVILNISSMNSFRPLTRIPAYSAAKAGVSTFTQWLAVHMAQEYSPRIRVNAIAPGFFLTDQNRFLLTEKESGELTPRGQSILSHTPMGRFGSPADLLGVVVPENPPPMACNSLGLILQKENNPGEAQQMFQEGLNVASDMGEKWIMQQSLVNLGFSKFALREVTEAQNCFLRSLHLALEAKWIPCILDSLAGIAWIYSGQGKEEAALELAIEVEKHPAVTQETKYRAIQLRAELESQLTPTQIEAIQAHTGEDF